MSDQSTSSSQRAYARLAGFMYLFVLVVDLSGLPLLSKTGYWHSVGQSCMFLGSLCTIPLAIGLYVALKPASRSLAFTALLCRLIEAVFGLLMTFLGFATLRFQLQSTRAGLWAASQLRTLDAMSIGVLSFSLGSTIFYYLFWKSRYIPRVMSLWGIFASLVIVIDCINHLLRPQYPVMTPGYLWVPMLFAEISAGIWLLIKAVDIKTVRPRRLDPATVSDLPPSLSI